jgi:MoaA/NifB/PqqE/SkfB family radical SAM enzyme
MAGLGRQLSLARRGLANIATNRPLCVSFEITHACNANCDHCHRGGPVDENQASAKDLIGIYQELAPPVIQVPSG